MHGSAGDILQLPLPHDFHWGNDQIREFSIVILYLISRFIYNVFFHPLRSFPGPTSHAMSQIPYIYKSLRGTLEFDILDLHKTYGDIVRIAPNELAISGPGSWKDILGNRRSGEEQLEKFKQYYSPTGGKKATSIIIADRDDHSRLRRQLAHGFSDKSMREQEPLITQHIDLLVKRFHERGGGGSKPFDLTQWYNYATFDVIGDLTFGESFGCLENAYFHPFVKLMLASGKIAVFLQCLSFFPLAKETFLNLIPRSAMKSQANVAKEKILRRMQLGIERPDLIEGLLKKKDEWNMSLDALSANARLLLVGGSETTATLLCGVTYLLLSNPQTLERLTAEVRSAFKSEDEINMSSANDLNYMLACLDEALRVYPPVPLGLPRVVPKGGCEISGKFIPEDTVVAVHHWATYHNEKYFTDPFAYHPERFLGDPKYASDKRDLLQPFHIGPRSCLGRKNQTDYTANDWLLLSHMSSLAYAEMRLILARLIYNFDMSLAKESANWLAKQKVFLFYTKPPLNVYMTPVNSRE
ncbi:trichothecene C-15 hydroxylase [Histoplasma capsulatum H143]|uniref:Trichothecene C-15 hydroxylase n=1 Tax=Ajellomyces capsulatus (strain H143) TaxID=544712 RepID=C6HFH3_AJECH|nr:trichothecene C-15 hydroxylase [Histoplasma capsulatum H143]